MKAFINSSQFDLEKYYFTEDQKKFYELIITRDIVNRYMKDGGFVYVIPYNDYIFIHYTVSNAGTSLIFFWSYSYSFNYIDIP